LDPGLRRDDAINHLDPGLALALVPDDAIKYLDPGLRRDDAFVANRGPLRGPLLDKCVT